MSEAKRLSDVRLAIIRQLVDSGHSSDVARDLLAHADSIEAELAAAKEECERLRDALRELHDFAGPLEHYRYTKRSKDAFEMAAKLLQEQTPNAVIAEHPIPCTKCQA